MRYFIDTEFINTERRLELLSIGIVCEDGREYYAQNLHCRLDTVDTPPFVCEQVAPHIEDPNYQVAWSHASGATEEGHVIYTPDPDANRLEQVYLAPSPVWRRPKRIATEITRFIDHNRPEIWGYYCGYDWVLLTRLFGSFEQLPKHWPYYCRDLKQWADALGNPRLPAQGKGEHHALKDARWNKTAWEYLAGYEIAASGSLRG